MGHHARTDRETDDSLPLQLLADLQQLFAEHGNPERLPTTVIINGLVALDDRPWATFSKTDKPITPHRLARMLKKFEIEPPRKGRKGVKTFRGYEKATCEDAFLRYLPSEAEQAEQPNKDGAKSPETEVERPIAVPHSKIAENPDKHCLVPLVPLSTSGDENEDWAAVFGASDPGAGPAPLTCAFGNPWLDHFRPPIGTGKGCTACAAGQPLTPRRETDEL